MSPRWRLFRPYPLIGYGVVALWLAAGMQWLIDRLPGWAAARFPAAAAGTRAPGPAGWTMALGALGGAALVVGSASASWRANDRSDSDFAERHAEVVFDLLPQDAVLFGYGDYSGPVGYYRYVEERRPDVAMYNLQGLVFANRLFDPRLPDEEKASVLDRFVGSTERAVFLFPDSRIRPGGRGFRHHGFLLEVLGEGTSSVQLARDPRGEQYFLELLDRQPTDRWEQVERNHHLKYYGQYLGLVVLVDPFLLEPMAPLFERAQDCYACLTGMATMVLSNGGVAAAHVNRIAAWLARAEELHDQALSKQESALLFFEQGRLSELTGDAPTAAARYRRAYAVYPHPESEAGDALRRLGLTP